MNAPSFFYSRDGDHYAATSATAGPWDEKLQHGGPVAALLGSRIEQAAARADARVAHFSLEFLGPVPLASLEVTTAVARPGKKIALWTSSARATSGGREAVRASAWVLSTAEGKNPSVHLEDQPVPPLPGEAITTFFKSVPRFGHGDSVEWRMVKGGFDAAGPSTAWTRLRVAIVEGEPVSPLARVLTMVDSANGISAELDVGEYLFVPVNLTVSLARPARGEWTGMSALTSLSSDGVGITRTHLFDEHGSIGEALQTLFVEKR